MRPAAAVPGQFADRDIGRARQRGGLLDDSAAAVGEHEAAIAPVARDAVREGKGEHDAGGYFVKRAQLSAFPSPLGGGVRDGGATN